MKRHFDSYRRLARGLFSCSSLWAGPDHFVYVRGTGVSLPIVEEYKRFRYEDIQAITMAPTRMYLWTTVLFCLQAVLSAAVVFLPDYDPGVRVGVAIAFLPVLSIAFLCLVVTLVRGPSCRCRIETSVGSVVIRPLSRQRAARRAIEKMSELVRGVQGEVYSGGSEVSLEETAPEASEAEEIARKGTGGEGARRIERSVFLVPTFLILGLFGGLWVVQAFVTYWWPLPVLGVLDLVVFLGLSVSLVQQMRTYTPGAILGALWTGMGQQLILMGTAFVAYIYWSVEVSVSRTGVLSLANVYLKAQEIGVVYYFSMINGLVSLILGLGGAVLVWRHRDRMRPRGRPPKLPPAVPLSALPRVESGDREGGGAP